jgi:hypothetical protein
MDKEAAKTILPSNIAVAMMAAVPAVSIPYTPQPATLTSLGFQLTDLDVNWSQPQHFLLGKVGSLISFQTCFVNEKLTKHLMDVNVQ